MRERKGEGGEEEEEERRVEQKKEEGNLYLHAAKHRIHDEPPGAWEGVVVMDGGEMRCQG